MYEWEKLSDPLYQLTSNIKACGDSQKYDAFVTGDDSKHNCPSQAFGLYVNMIEDDSLPS